MSGGFQAERAVSPLDGVRCGLCSTPNSSFTVRPADFLRGLHGASRSPHTIRAYSGRVAVFLSWCEEHSIGWRAIGLADLARFKHWLEAAPIGPAWPGTGATVNAILTAVCEFLRFCARTGLIDQAVADRLSEPRWLRFVPTWGSTSANVASSARCGPGGQGAGRGTVP